jgi:diguanylate cyclase (GGDEF)-like protein
LRDSHSSLREVALLQEATDLILSSMDADTVLHQILLIVRNHFQISKCAVLLVDEAKNELYCRAQNGYPLAAPTVGRRLKIGDDGVCGHVAMTRLPLYVPDVSKEPRYIAADPSIASELAIPLVIRDKVVGVLNLESENVDHFTDEMIGLMAIFAGQASVALENARLYSVERRRMRQVEFINLIARSATTANDLDQLLLTLSELISDTFDGSEVSVLLRDPAGVFSLTAHAGGDQPHEAAFLASVRHGVISEAMDARMNVVVNNIAEHATNHSEYKPCLPSSLSEMAVPLHSLGETLGVIVISNKLANFFSADDRSIAQAAADVCATAIKNVQLADELRRVANTDSLTGLYNQRYFHVVVVHEIARAKRYSKTFSVVMFDLQNFRHVNQESGFESGDEILRGVAHQLKSSVRSNDTVCRYAANRFAVVLPETEQKHVNIVANKISKSLSAFFASKKLTELKALFALVHYPEDGVTELELVRHLINKIERQKTQTAGASA